MRTIKNFSLFAIFMAFVSLVIYACSAGQNDWEQDMENELELKTAMSRSVLNDTCQQVFFKLMEKYKLEKVTDEEVLLETKDITPITNIEQLKQLDKILSSLNTCEEGNHDHILSIPERPLLKRRSPEYGQGTVAISGSNEDGRATVYVNLETPSVEGSTYTLGIMDAFIGYDHITGSAYRGSDIITFTAYGQGYVKLIIEGIELFKFNVTIDGYCDFNGNGELTSF